MIEPDSALTGAWDETMVAPAHVTLRPGVGHAVIALTGEFDLASAPQLPPVIHRLLAQGRNHITLDLDDITFLDCFTVALLLIADRDVARAGGALDITHNPLCARLLAMTGTSLTLTTSSPAP